MDGGVRYTATSKHVCNIDLPGGGVALVLNLLELASGEGEGEGMLPRSTIRWGKGVRLTDSEYNIY